MKRKCRDPWGHFTHARLRFPVERAFTRLKAWRIFRKAKISPNRLTSITKAVLVLERRR